ncbi:hypothetical protein [Streptomyces pinistramenti]|uniref:hypothetical protein n=1 Tax=Streptomyces pinistramenti TaxID=2884812 RepID=UPI001D098003|nr:hypothetical protein [Streptomyces pinistramenti]MCB5905908.1 hypothetical protein [Streptomyces pinistramenti]
MAFLLAGVVPDRDRAIGIPHDLRDLAVVGGQRGLVGALAAVRDQQHGPARHPGSSCSDNRGGLGPVLLGQA